MYDVRRGAMRGDSGISVLPLGRITEGLRLVSESVQQAFTKHSGVACSHSPMWGQGRMYIQSACACIRAVYVHICSDLRRGFARTCHGARDTADKLRCGRAVRSSRTVRGGR